MHTELQLSQATPTTLPDDLVTMVDNNLMVSSLKIAEHFGKKHKNVLRAIENLECSEDFNRLNFEPVTETIVRATGGMNIPAINMTRDGFTFLVMGFTGKNAAQWKEKYIGAFNAMEAQVKNMGLVPDFSDPRNLLACFEHLNGQVSQLQGTVANQSVRLQKLNRLEGADGSMCITDAAKTLGIQLKKLTQFMSSRRWIYKRVGNKNWVAFADKQQANYLEHDDHIYLDREGRERVSTRALVTAKGLVKLAELLEQPLN